jgi:ribosomal protein S18 acetylase RimI-like enzyme
MTTIQVEFLRANELEAACKLEQESGLSPMPFDEMCKRLQDAKYLLLGAHLLARSEAGLVREKQLVGIFTGWVVGQEVEVDNLTVAASHRRVGAGKTLLLNALSQAWGKGGRQVFLEVRESNFPALQLYYSLGFTVNGRRRLYYNYPAEDALLLTLEAQSYLALMQRLIP